MLKVFPLVGARSSGPGRLASFFKKHLIRSFATWLLIGTSVDTRKTKENATMSKRTIKILIILTLAICAMGLGAQMLPNPYGPPIGVESAKKAAAAALAEAVKNHWNMAVAVVDPNGTLVYYEKMDNTQI